MRGKVLEIDAGSQIKTGSMPLPHFTQSVSRPNCHDVLVKVLQHLVQASNWEVHRERVKGTPS